MVISGNASTALILLISRFLCDQQPTYNDMTSYSVPHNIKRFIISNDIIFIGAKKKKAKVSGEGTVFQVAHLKHETIIYPKRS